MPRSDGNRLIRPETAALTRGYARPPSLRRLGPRPAVFRSSTFAFLSPEAAEHPFAVALGKKPVLADEDAELI